MISNQVVWNKTGQEEITEGKWEWVGHALRKGKGVAEKRHSELEP